MKHVSKGLVGWVAAVVVALGAGVVLGRWAFMPPAADNKALTPATVTVTEMTVGQSTPVAVSAEWTMAPLGIGASEGTLTSLKVATGDTVKAGQIIYTVDLRPVTVAQGEVPAFRDLEQGDSGADVAQLQEMLIAKDLYHGTADGYFSRPTLSAVSAWHKSMGIEQDGIVHAGDIVYAEHLPSRVLIADDIAVGTRIHPGDPVLKALIGTPRFIAVSYSGNAVDTSLPIEVTFNGEPVTAIVAESNDDGGGNTLMDLTREDGSPLCADACDDVPLSSQEAVYPARQIMVPPVTGPGVPAAAVQLDAQGSAFVVDQNGTSIPVTILGQGQGSAVLEGVEVGQIVVLPNSDGEGS
ncbi:MAG: peptidoglycan-binding protein [Cellulomonadaceae bacterium]|nr:peptidoglycan-binding protein [Cellulomonadaceae bacterium]